MILVTGGSGFLGGAVARALLNRGESVRVVQRRDAPALRAAGAEVVQADLAERDATINALRGVRAVMHIAASTRMWGDEAATRRANVDATRNVIEACQMHGIRSLVYTSTPSVVHPGGDVEGVNESVPVATHFLSPYPATKAEAERMVLAANGPTLATCALRPHLIWGPNDPQVTARVIDRARRGRLRPLAAATSSLTAPISTTPSLRTSLHSIASNPALPAPETRILLRRASRCRNIS